MENRHLGNVGKCRSVFMDLQAILMPSGDRLKSVEVNTCEPVVVRSNSVSWVSVFNSSAFSCAGEGFVGLLSADPLMIKSLKH
jgi:hypothetical protein